MVLYKSEELCSPAQKEGFEPSRRYQRPTPFPGEPLQPLGYFCSVESLKYIIFQQASLTFVCSGEGGIRTHAPLRTNGFQDRLVMTTSIPLQRCFSILQKQVLFVKAFFHFFKVFVLPPRCQQPVSEATLIVYHLFRQMSTIFFIFFRSIFSHYARSTLREPGPARQQPFTAGTQTF